MSTKDFRTQNEIVVTVKDRNRSDDAAAAKPKTRKGTVPPGKPAKRFLHRRKVTPKGINFYDLGQIVAGAGFDDTDYQVPNTPIFGLGDIAAPDPTTSDFEGRDAPLLAIPTAQLLNKVRKITKGSLSAKYHVLALFGSYVDELDNLEQWTAGGLVVDQADLNTGLTIAANAAPYFDAVVLKDGEPNQKITTAPEYSAPAAAFSPVPLMDVFLVPKLAYLQGRATTPTFGDVGQYGAIYLTLPRRFGINTADEWNGGDLSPLPPIGAGMDAATLEAINNWKGVVPNRGFFWTYLTNTWTTNAAFPPAGHHTRGISAMGSYSPFTYGPNGALLAIVKKGSTFYYFWTDGF